MSEIWLPIKDYEGWYEVSNMGRVRSVNRVVEARDGSKRFYKGQVLATRPNHQRNDYVVVDLKKNGTQKTCRVQRLVLSTFNPVENMENLQVGHKDENVANNQLDNLYWTTAKDNSNYGNHNYALSKSRGGKPVQQLTVDGEVVAEYPYLSIAIKQTGIQHIGDVISGKRNTAGGFIWRYLDV